ncbi:MAG TPA: ThuA domain-containing protein [Solirubrobacteraceae bacterium]|nr:ThuA domain-containing protein [Solirubrobacteraceae bacterium]
MRAPAVLIACLVAGAILASPAAAAPKRVYVVSETRGFVHDSIPAAVAFFQELGRRSPRYDVVHLRSSGAAGLTVARLRGASAVVLANTTGELPLPSRSALRDFVRRGGALVGTHSASDTWHEWPAYEPLLGAEFQRHGSAQSGRLLVEGPTHAIVRGLPRSYRMHEEFYEFRASPRRRARVLVRLDPASISDEARPDIPLVWARTEGRGRVFYDALGHFSETWRLPYHRRLVSQGLAWALRI